MPFGKKATTKKAKKQKAKEAPSEKTKEMGGPLSMSYSPNKMGHSPAEMGHSPNEMSLKNNKDIKYAGDVADETAQKSAMKPFTHKHFGARSAAMMKGDSPAKHKLEDATKGTHWHAEDGTIITEKEGKKHKQKLPTGPNVPPQMKYDSPAGKHCM